MMSDATDEQLSHFRSNIFPVIQFFKQEELLHVVRYTYAIYRYIQDENTVSHTCIYSFGQVTLERSFLEIFHDIYDKVLLILSRLPQSPTHEIMTEAKEVVEAITLLTSPVRNNSSINRREFSSKERSRVVNKSSNQHHKALNKDVRDVLSLVQAGSIMERVSSVNAKSRKKQANSVLRKHFFLNGRPPRLTSSEYQLSHHIINNNTEKTNTNRLYSLTRKQD